MQHATPLIATLVAALTLALILGAAARWARLSPLVGYLLAGVLIGPNTPGFVADQPIAAELAEIGVILLMFGVGLHFSVGELAAVRGVAVPGALGQIAAATAMGWGLARLWGWGDAAGLMFGFALSVASTVVLLRALGEAGALESERGHIAVGWLVVEDLAMVVAIVLIPALAGSGSGSGLAGPLLLTLAKATAFVALMLIVGRRALPWLLSRVWALRSRELFSLATLVTALGIAFAASALFGVSFALGAFFAGLVLSGSPLSLKAAEQTLPLRDAFAVLFFVSVGMLFDPAILVERPAELAGTLAVVVLGKSAAAWAIARACGRDGATALTVAASLAQIGEFSFILAGLGVALGLLPEEGRDLILAAALVSIALHPLVFGLAARRASAAPAPPAA